MKSFLYGIIVIPLLFAVNSYGQLYSKDQLKDVEAAAVWAGKDTLSFTIEELKTENSFNSVAIKAFQIVDSLILFVSTKKQDKKATFDSVVVPFLEIKCRELNFESLNLNEDETLIYDSFLQVFKWDKTIEIVRLYEVYIFKNSKDQEEAKSLLTVLSFIKQVYFYIKSKTVHQSDPYLCIAANFDNNNEVDWRVFAQNPCKLIFWTIAACAWEAKPEN
jgi:hypothetical protein